MNNRPQDPPAGGLALDDVYYVLFRHKWKIIILFAAGLLAASAVYRLKPPDYQSEAKLLIKYVVDNTSPAPTESDAHMQSTDPQGQTIINTEIEILTSLDVARKVVDDLGPDKILPKSVVGRDPAQAAGYVNAHLKVVQSGKSSVLNVDFKHPDPEMVRPILSQIITEYEIEHHEAHQPGGTHSDFFTRTTDDLKNKLAGIEKELKSARTNAGVISTENALQDYAKYIQKTSQDILDAKAEMAYLTASFSFMTQLSSGKAPSTNANSTLPLKPETPPVPESIAREYARVCRYLLTLEARDEELASQHFLPRSTPVTDNRADMQKVEEQKQKLENENPGLKLASAPMMASVLPAQPGQPSINPLSSQAAQIAALQHKIDFLESQLKEFQDKQSRVADIEPQVSALELEKKQVEDDYQAYSKSLAVARLNEELGAGKAPNIVVIQRPSDPGRDWSKRYKMMEMLAVAGLGGGLTWAFLIEFYLDTTVKRPKEVKKKLGMSLFLSIPDIKRSGPHRRALTNGRLLLKNAEDGSPAVAGDGSPGAAARLEIAPWDPGHVLRPFYEALRDRLLGYFEARNLTHNPKLVAVTGSSKGSGATTLAMGLAASLSETGDGNVLLVDMNQEHGASQHFHKGKPNCGLDDVLENGNRQTALVQDNLYVVNANSNGDHLPRILPKRFASLVPKFKASDFDYIIFDMPPISQTSITLRLAGFMDTVLLVVESEKTNREAVQQAGSLLVEAKANVNVVLNKTRSYIPARLHEEF